MTIAGRRKRGHGSPTTPLHDGMLVWSRVRMPKDPDTGKRISRPNPGAEWHRTEAEHLRIVDQALFERAGT